MAARRAGSNRGKPPAPTKTSGKATNKTTPKVSPSVTSSTTSKAGETSASDRKAQLAKLLEQQRRDAEAERIRLAKEEEQKEMIRQLQEQLAEDERTAAAKQEEEERLAKEKAAKKSKATKTKASVEKGSGKGKKKQTANDTEDEEEEEEEEEPAKKKKKKKAAKVEVEEEEEEDEDAVSVYSYADTVNDEEIEAQLPKGKVRHDLMCCYNCVNLGDTKRCKIKPETADYVNAYRQARRLRQALPKKKRIEPCAYCAHKGKKCIPYNCIDVEFDFPPKPIRIHPADLDVLAKKVLELFRGEMRKGLRGVIRATSSATPKKIADLLFPRGPDDTDSEWTSDDEEDEEEGKNEMQVDPPKETTWTSKFGNTTVPPRSPSASDLQQRGENDHHSSRSRSASRNAASGDEDEMELDDPSQTQSQGGHKRKKRNSDGADEEGPSIPAKSLRRGTSSRGSSAVADGRAKADVSKVKQKRVGATRKKTKSPSPRPHMVESQPM